MADSVRIVRFTAGGQIEELLHVQSSLDYSITNMGFERETLEFVQGDRNQRMVKSGSRYGGERYAGESVGNGAYKFKLLSSAPTADALLAKLSLLIAELERVPGQHYIEHQMDGATYPSYYEVRAPAKSSPVYKWAQAAGAGSMVMDVEWPVAPLVCGAPMDITDNDVEGNLADYTFDESSASGYPLSGGDALTVERRFAHTSRGYLYGDHETHFRGVVGGTVTGFKASAIVKRTADDTYIDGYVDDNGTNSRLRIDVVIDGSRTNRATVNLSSRLTSTSVVHVVTRIVGNDVFLTLYSAHPFTGSAPINTRSYTLVGAEITALGSNVVGNGCGAIIPIAADAEVTSFACFPYSYPSTQTPVVHALGGDIPGDAPARVDVRVQSEYNALFGMIAWAVTPESVGAVASPALSVRQAEDYAVPGTWPVVSEGSCSGGELAQLTASGEIAFASGPTVAADTPCINLGPIYRDPGGDLQDAILEVWAIVRLGSGVINPRFRAALRGESWGLIFTTEHASEGRPVYAPLTGTSRQFIRLGSFDVSERGTDIIDGETGYIGDLFVDASCEDGSSGAIGIDYAITNYSGKRASSPTGKTWDSALPYFKITDGIKIFRHDLSGIESADGSSEMIPSAGLTGSLIELEPGPVSCLLRTGSRPADQVSAPSGGETASENASSMRVHYAVTPRWHFQRPN